MAVTLMNLWLPILLSAVFVFAASSVIHMCLPLHRKDYVKLPNEDAVLDALRSNGVGAGEYMFPCAASMKEMRTPEMAAKRERGPVGTLVVVSGGCSVGKSLLQWFLFTVVVAALVAYTATLGLRQGADYAAVFRLTCTVALIGHGFTNVTSSIWKGVRWATTLRFLFDGIVYALVTAGTFGWLWPR